MLGQMSDPSVGPVRVVGAGVAGLTVARLLQAAGLPVVVEEATHRPGGKLGLLEVDGRRFDTGPSLLTWPAVLRETLAACGERLDDRLHLVRLHPLFRYLFPDGTEVDGPDDPEWHAFVDRMTPMWEAVEVPFLRRPLALRPHLRRLPDLARISPLRTLHQLASHELSDPRLVRIAERYATYAGSDPYRAPGTLAVIPVLEAQQGGWHVMGGLHRIAEVLAEGLDIRYGIRSAPGPAPEVWAAGVTPRRPSLSGFVLLMGVRRLPERLLHHTVVFSDDYRTEFEELAAGRFPSDPTVYLCAPGRTDPSLDGTLFAMANAPATGCGTGAARQAILRRLARSGIEPEIDTCTVRTPADYGPIYGEASHSPWAAFRRLRVRAGPGHYRAGGGAHPGGGLPLAMLSGTMAADAVLLDAAI